MLRRALALAFALPLLAAPLGAIAATPTVATATSVKAAKPVLKTDAATQKKPHKQHKPKKKSA